MNRQQQKWLYLSLLSLVWGSSFILMKKALTGVSPMQLGALRMIITALFLVLIGFKRLYKIQKKQWRYIVYTSFLGTFLPEVSFCLCRSSDR